MNDDKQQVWEKIASQISGAWDLIALACGVVLGTVVSLVTRTDNWSQYCAIGGCICLVIRKLFAESFQRRGLKRKAEKLQCLINQLPAREDAESLSVQLRSETLLWKYRITSNKDFRTQLDIIIENYRGFFKYCL
jgi:hypothetical protein